VGFDSGHAVEGGNRVLNRPLVEARIKCQISKGYGCVYSWAMEGSKVYKLRIRGNYDALCRKLGQELRQEIYEEHFRQVQEGQSPEDVSEDFVKVIEEKLSPCQMSLFNICRGMNFKNFTCRPAWAGGAHIFVTPAVADEVEDAFEGDDLGNRDVVVSPEYVRVVVDALAEGSGSRKSCAYVHEPSSTAHPLRVFSQVDAKNEFLQSWMTTHRVSLDDLEAVSEYSLDGSKSARLTHSTGSVPRGEEKSWGHSNACVARSSQDGVSLGPTAYKKFSLISAVGLAENATEVTEVLTDTDLDTETWEPGSAMAVGDFLEHHFDAKPRPMLKTGPAFGSFFSEHFARMTSDVAAPYLECLPLENSLASTDSDDRSALKRVYKLLKSVAMDLFSAESLDVFLRKSVPPEDTPPALLKAFDESTEILAAEMAELLAEECKPLLSQKWHQWKKNHRGTQDAGCHKAAEDLRDSFREVVAATCAKVDITIVARRAWSKQNESRRQAMKDQEKANQDQVEDVKGKGKGKTKIRKFKNRQGACDRKNGRMDESHQAWQGEKASMISRPRPPVNLLR